jgi:hypothetical protein
MSLDDARDFEMRMLGLRIHLVVGWGGDGDVESVDVGGGGGGAGIGRLGVLGVMC